MAAPDHFGAAIDLATFHISLAGTASFTPVSTVSFALVDVAAFSLAARLKAIIAADEDTVISSQNKKIWEKMEPYTA